MTDKKEENGKIVKVVLEYKKLEPIEMEYNGTKYLLLPHLSVPEQVFLIKRYIEDYFSVDKERLLSVSPYNLFEAKYNQLNYILQILTNVDPGEGFVSKLYGDESFWDTLREKIDNYDSFIDKQDKIVQEVKEGIMLSSSIGVVVESLVEKLYSLLEKFSEITPEEVEKLKKSGLELLEKLEDSSIIKDATRGK